LERNLFFRIYYASNGNINKSIEKKLFLKQTFTEETLLKTEKLDNFFFGYLFFKKIYKAKNPFEKIEKNIYGQIFAMTILYKPSEITNYTSSINKNMGDFKERWKEFTQKAALIKKSHNRTYIDNETQAPVSYFSESKWFRSELFEKDVINYFVNNGKIEDNSDIEFRAARNVAILNKRTLSDSGLPLKDRIELNIENNKNRIRIAEAKLSRFVIELNDLKDKMDSSTSEEGKYTISGWISEVEIKIDQAKNNIETYNKWIIEDVEKLSDLLA
jgi:hypothetical protein